MSREYEKPKNPERLTSTNSGGRAGPLPSSHITRVAFFGVQLIFKELNLYDQVVKGWFTPAIAATQRQLVAGFFNEHS